MTNRREFLQKSTAILGLSPWLLAKKQQPLLSFSTLGCPNWTFAQIVNHANANHFAGIEIRGIQGEMDLPKCPSFSASNLGSTRRMVTDANLKIVNLGSSANLHYLQTDKRKGQLDEAKRYIELASQLACPYIRVFPNDLPANQSEQATLQAIIEGLQELGDFARTSGVKVLLESHGKVIKTDMLLKIMQDTNHEQVGLVWDFFNMWSVTQESPTYMYERLKKYIFHTHIKDGIVSSSGETYTLLGEGNAPVQEALHALKSGAYAGYYSFEWEKRWHPEIQEPEIALPHFAKKFSTYWRS